MRFQCADPVGYPVDLVYHFIRDEMPKLVPYLSDVDAIEVLERKEEPGGSRITNLWRGSHARVPAMLHKLITPDLLTWKDHAFWPKDARHAEWTNEPRFGGKLFECKGKTTIAPGNREGTCRVEIAGELNVYPERLPGVPRLLAGSIRGKVESLIVAMIVPNLQTMAKGVQGYFDDQGAKPA